MNVGKLVVGVSAVLAVIAIAFGTVAAVPSAAPSIPTSGGYCLSWASVPPPGQRRLAIAFRVDNPSNAPIRIRGIVAEDQVGLSSAVVRVSGVTSRNLSRLPVGVSAASTVSQLAAGSSVRPASGTVIPAHGRVAVITVLTLAPRATFGRVTSFDLSYDGRLGVIRSRTILLSLAVGLTSGDCRINS
jgi:hypothetical protein